MTRQILKVKTKRTRQK